MFPTEIPADDTLPASVQPSGLESASVRMWRVGAERWELGRFPKLMGIVNVTPDSFSDGGQFVDLAAAIAQALRLVEEGADILDIGGESTRPGAIPVPLDEELRRVVPVIHELSAQTRMPTSIDTTKAEVARQSLSTGAASVNDISGLTFDPAMPRV